jgi:ribosomal protein L17
VKQHQQLQLKEQQTSPLKVELANQLTNRQKEATSPQISQQRVVINQLINPQKEVTNQHRAAINQLTGPLINLPRVATSLRRLLVEMEPEYHLLSFAVVKERLQ